ncbi:MAG: transcription-repair coupling factor, partial [Casimicrobiaceae bacterium]
MTDPALAPFRTLLPELPRAGEFRRPGPLPGAARALALAATAIELSGSKRMLALVCADAHEASTLAAEIAWCAPALRVLEFSDWETLAYDHFSPHPDLVSDRLRALHALAERRCDVLVVAATTLALRVTPRA